MDAYVVQPWRHPDEQFYRAVGELLAEWERMHRPPFEAVRVVGDRWDAYPHGLQDALQRSGVPYRFYEAGSTDGRELLDSTAQSDPLPVAILSDGRVLPKPTAAEIAEASESMPIPALRSSTSPLLAPVPPAWRQPSTEHQKAFEFWSSKTRPSAVRLGRAR